MGTLEQLNGFLPISFVSLRGGRWHGSIICTHLLQSLLRPIAYAHTSNKKPNENSKLVASFIDVLFFFSFCHDFDLQLFEFFVWFPNGKLDITHAQK